MNAEQSAPQAATAKAKPRIEAPNYSHIPNAILDNLTAYEDSELRVVLVMCRQTFGWHRERAALSIKFLQKATGLSHQAVITATKALVDAGLVSKTKNGGAGGSNVFGLVVGFQEDEKSPPSQVQLTTLSSGVDTPLSSPVDYPLSSAVDTNKERIKKEEKEGDAAGGGSPDGKASEKQGGKRKAKAIMLEIPANLQTEEFIEAWAEWVDYRKELGKPMTERTKAAQIKKYSRFGPVASIAAMREAIENGWQGAFPQKHANSRSHAPSTPPRPVSDFFPPELILDPGEEPPRPMAPADRDVTT